MMSVSNRENKGRVSLRLALDAMGTRFELLIADDASETAIRALGEDALACIDDWHRRLSAFDKGSVVSAINAGAGTRAVRVDRDMLDLLLACRRWHAETCGAFDVTLGALMQHHGFRGDASVVSQSPAFGMRYVEIDEDQDAVFLSHPDVQLDFGGVAKGWAIDEACENLKESGVVSAIIHGGTSTAKAIGVRPDGKPWRVKVHGDDDAPAALLAGASLSVSAPSGRVNDRQQGHVLDPRTGGPTKALNLAAAIADNAAASDMWATALLVMGKRPESMPGTIASILHLADGSWRIEGESTVRCIAANIKGRDT